MFRPVDPKPNFPKLEEEILAFWEKEKIFEKSLEQTKKGKPFVFYEGPPTANAAPGIHHIEARAFKDLIPRYQTMRGCHVVRKAGWDTHGLPVELQIEKKLGISGKKQIESLKENVSESIKYFNKLCRESVWQFKEEWERLTKRMGFWLDLEHPYITYESSYIEALWGILKKIYNKKLIYQGHKVVPYCPRCGTALSSHEVAQGYQTVKDNSVYVKFKLKDPASCQLPANTFLLAWTTTPWTLPGNVALAIGKDIEYAKVKAGEEYYIVAKDRASSVIASGNPRGNPEIASTFAKATADRSESTPRNDEVIKGRDLVGLEYEPLFDIPALKNDKSYKIYPADFVTTTDGTGVVHTAVMYGEDDYTLGGKIGLSKHHTVDEEGLFNADLKAFGLAGLKVRDKETETKLFEYLKSKNLLLKTEAYEHEYPHCWRCNTALLYYARTSWFIEMSKLRKQLLKNNGKINWIPDHIKDGRFGEWLKDVKDWAISRERYWGTPLPFWKCKECNELKVVGSIKELPHPNPLLVKEREKGEVDLHRPYVDEIKLKCECGGEMARIPEVVDVWFDSGAMPFASGQEQFPADFISEAIDQTRGWFYTLLAISTLLDKGPAYKNVICLGHVLDEKGKKMSKSKGNAVDPFVLGDKYGFDIIRWYFYSVNQPGDPKLFAEKDLQSMQRRTQLILWNVYNYFITYANAQSWKYDGKELKSDNVLDLWLDARLKQLVMVVTKNLEEYDAFHASREIESFIEQLSTWYVRRSRGRTDSDFFAHLYHSLITLVKLLAPFMPFMAEDIYQNIHDSNFTESVHLAEWPQSKKLSKKQTDLTQQMQQLRKLVEEAHALRAKAGIKLRQPLARLVIPKNSPPHEEGQGEVAGDKVTMTPSNSPSRGGELTPELLDILKDEVNVKEVVLGDKLELDTNLSDDLKLEGLTAELTRQIQALRKELGLKIGEMAELHYQSDSDIIKRAMEKVDRKKTYVSRVELIKSLTPSKEFEVEGHVFKLKLQISNDKSNPKSKCPKYFDIL